MIDLFPEATKEELVERKERKEEWRLKQYATIMEENKDQLKLHVFNPTTRVANAICKRCGCSTLAICCFNFDCNPEVNRSVRDEDVAMFSRDVE